MMICKFSGARLWMAMALSCAYLMSYTTATAQTFSIPEKNPTLQRAFECIEVQTSIGCDFIGDLRILKRKLHGRLLNLSLDKFIAVYPRQLGLNADRRGNRILFWKPSAPAPSAPPPPRMLYYVCGTVRRANTGSDIIFLPNIKVAVKGTETFTYTRPTGDFHFDSVAKNAILVFSGPHVYTAEVRVRGGQSMAIALTDSATSLEEVIVTNGIIHGRKDSIPGAIDDISRRMLDKQPFINILDKLQDQTPGVSITHDGTTTGKVNIEDITIMGAGSITGGHKPQLIVDGFIYTGDAGNINPDDVGNIDIPKDPASLADWGARGGNGVIVINTKKDTSKHASITFINTFNFQDRPDVYNYHPMPSGELVEIEKQAYIKGYYAPYLDSRLDLPFSPVITLLHNADIGLISPQQAAENIIALKGYDVRRDIERYFYRKSLEQQYTIQIAKNTSRFSSFLSGSYTHTTGNLRGSTQSRYTTLAQIIYKITPRLTLTATINNSVVIDNSNGNPGAGYKSPNTNNSLPTDFRFKDSQGNPLAFYGNADSAWLHNMTSQGFLNAAWRPLVDPQLESITQRTSGYLANLGLQYVINPFLNFEVKYQFQTQSRVNNDFRPADSYFAMDLRNQTMRFDPSTGAFIPSIPPGGVSDYSRQNTTSHEARAQINLDKKLNDDYALSALTGIDFYNIAATGDTSRWLGMSNANAPHIYSDSLLFPPIGPNKFIDRSISTFFSSRLNYKDRYAASLSFREDFADLFGASTNKKWSPFWSIGGLWRISNESFYDAPFIPELSLRLSTGTMGNISRASGAGATITTTTGGVTGTPYTIADVDNLPNADLRWEKIRMHFMSLDFALKKYVLTGTISPYLRLSSGLIVPVLVDPTVGAVQTNGVPAYSYKNSAGMRTTGLDLTLKSHNLSHKLDWTTTFLLSLISSEVTNYSPLSNIGTDYLDPYLLHPLVSRPLQGIYAFKWHGLNGQTGDPLRYWNGLPSTDWQTIYEHTPLDSMVYKGPSQPRVFGSIRNTFTIKNFSLSILVSYRLGYVVRMPAFSSSDLLDHWNTYAPVSAPFQKPGDEKFTSVPSINYSGNGFRDLLYGYSEIMVVNAGNIRLENITFTYRIAKRKIDGTRYIKLFAGISNLGPLWIANKYHFDPFYPQMPRAGVRFSAGFNINFNH